MSVFSLAPIFTSQLPSCFCSVILLSAFPALFYSLFHESFFFFWVCLLQLEVGLQHIRASFNLASKAKNSSEDEVAQAPAQASNAGTCSRSWAGV